MLIKSICLFLYKEIKNEKKGNYYANALVYHVIHSFTEFGEMESYLFVGDHPNEWEMDRADLKAGQQFAYVLNHDMPDDSEFGSVGVALTAAAGLKRTW